MNILLIFGGMSYEHEISISSFLNVYTYINKEKYNIHVIYITKDGKWVYLNDEKSILAKDFSGSPAILSPDAVDKSIILLDTFEKIKIDCVFPVLHGKNGEDGTIQGLFTLAKIPFVGCDVASSANSLDKSLTKIVIDTTNVAQSPYHLIIKRDYDENVIEDKASDLTYPLFVKCTSGGSSVGVYKSNDIAELKKHIKEAFELDTKVLIEQGISGKEVEVAVLGNENPIASTVGEIAPEDGFYSFDAKYVDNSSKLYIPARIEPKIIEKVRENALIVYKALGCKGLSRVDFFVTEENEVIFNEINTLPGFTNISMYPKLFEHEGVSYTKLIDKLIDFAIESGENHG